MVKFDPKQNPKLAAETKKFVEDTYKEFPKLSEALSNL